MISIRKIFNGDCGACGEYAHARVAFNRVLTSAYGPDEIVQPALLILCPDCARDAAALVPAEDPAVPAVARPNPHGRNSGRRHGPARSTR